MAARHLLRAAVTRPIAKSGAAGERRGSVVMTVATAMASVFITITLVCVPRVAGRRWLGQLTAVGGLIFLTEENTGRAYLVDTGAAVSVVPFRGRPATATAYLMGPDNKVIPAWGSVRLQLRFGGTTFDGDFVQAAVSKPILGVDFLARHKLLVDAASHRVLDAHSLKPPALPNIPCPVPVAAAIGHIVPAV
jgi:hypothetical protein